MTKRYFLITGQQGYSFDSEVIGKTFEAVRVGHDSVSLTIDITHGYWKPGAEWNFFMDKVEEVFKYKRRAERTKNVRAPKQTPPVPKQRKLNIRYASGKDYHLKNVTNVVVDTRTNELKVSYNQNRDGTEFRVNFTVPFADLTAINFQDKVSKVSTGYFFEDGELVHRVEHFATKPKVFQH